MNHKYTRYYPEIKILETIISIPFELLNCLLYKNYLIYYQNPLIKFYDLNQQRNTYTYNLEGCRNFAILNENKIVFLGGEKDYMYILNFFNAIYSFI